MQDTWGRGTPAWGGGPLGWGDLERVPWGWGDLERGIPGAFTIWPWLLGAAVGGCPCNWPPHSLPLAHEMMNPEVPAPCQRLLCPPSLPVVALPAPPAHPTHPYPLAAVSSAVFAPAPLQQSHGMGAQAPGTGRAVAAGRLPSSTDSPEHTLPATHSSTSLNSREPRRAGANFNIAC